MIALFDRFEITLTRAQAESASHAGPCDDDVAFLLTLPGIKRQLAKIQVNDIRAELRETGAWNTEELADDAANRARIVWIAAGNIKEEQRA